MLAQKKIDFDDWAKYLQIYSMNEPTYVFLEGWGASLNVHRASKKRGAAYSMGGWGDIKKSHF